MNNKEIFKKIGVILTELNEQYRYISESPQSLNEFEIELMKANAKFLGDHVSIMQRLFHTEAMAAEAREQKPPDEVQPPASSPAPDSQPEAESQSASVDNPAPGEETLPDAATVETEEEEEPAEEITEAAVPEPELTLEEKEPETEMPVVNQVEISERTVAIDEKPRADQPKTVNDLLAAARGTSLGDSINRQPVSDLKAAINLNDKLLFIKELFNGYSLAYSEAVDIANRSASYDEVKHFLETNYAGKNSWDLKPLARDRFYEIIAQRFVG